MVNLPTPNYQQLIAQSGIPTDRDAWRERLQHTLAQEGLILNHDSHYSPFWRLIEQSVIKPTHWLVNDLLANHVLPNQFLATAQGPWLEQMAWQCLIERHPASKALGHIEFQRGTHQGVELTISQGTWVQTDPINGVVYRVKVQKDTVLKADATTVSVPVEAEFAGDSYNLGSGYYHILPEAIPGILGARNAASWLIQPGSNAESDDDLRLRVRNQWSAIGKWHIDASYRTLLAEHGELAHHNIYFSHHAPRGPGSANAYILLDMGEPEPALISKLNQHIQSGQHGHGDDLQVFAMPSTPVDVSLQIWTHQSLDASAQAALCQAVRHCIGAAFRENNRYAMTLTAPHSRFSFSKLSEEIHQHFPAIASLHFHNQDILNAMAVPRLRQLEVRYETA